MYFLLGQVAKITVTIHSVTELPNFIGCIQVVYGLLGLRTCRDFVVNLKKPNKVRTNYAAYSQTKVFKVAAPYNRKILGITCGNHGLNHL